MFYFRMANRNLKWYVQALLSPLSSLKNIFKMPGTIWCPKRLSQVLPTTTWVQVFCPRLHSGVLLGIEFVQQGSGKAFGMTHPLNPLPLTSFTFLHLLYKCERYWSMFRSVSASELMCKRKEKLVSIWAN